MVDQPENSIPIPHSPFLNQHGEEYSSILDNIIAIFEGKYPESITSRLPFSTSAKPALSRLSKNQSLKYRDEIQQVLLLQSFAPEEITPRLILLTEELRKEGIVNWASAQGGKVLQLATGAFHIVEQSSRYSEDVPEKKGGLGIFGRRKR